MAKEFDTERTGPAPSTDLPESRHTMHDTSRVGGATLTGEGLHGSGPDSRASASSGAPPAGKKKGSGNKVLFIAFAILAFVVLVAGYVMFSHMHAPARHAVPHPVAVAPSVKPATHTPAPFAAPSTSANPDTLSLLTGTPTKPQSSAPSATLPASPTAPAPSVLTPSPTQAPALASAPAAQPPASQTQANQAPAPQASPLLAAPAPAATVAAAAPASPAQDVIQSGSTGSELAGIRASIDTLQTSVNSLQAGHAALQAQVDTIEARLPSRTAQHARTQAHAFGTGPQVSRHAHSRRHARHDHNLVERAQPAKDLPAKKDKAADAAPVVSCHLAAIVPDRAWVKHPDGSFTTYGVGDTSPNGARITAISPDAGITTTRGHLACTQ